MVEPAFPVPAKSRNHKDFLPNGLLKIGAWLQANGTTVRLKRGVPANKAEQDGVKRFDPDEVWVTSLFTYWAEYVRAAVRGYRGLVPRAKIVVGGIYASLFPPEEVMRYTGCDAVHQGVIPEAEGYQPDYSLLGNSGQRLPDYQILHATRGCPRHCRFCGTWRIEPKFSAVGSLKDRFFSRKLVFYDNNIFMHDGIENILEELAELKRTGKILWCESQSGFDGRILVRKPHLASMLKKAGFRYPRIAWDWHHSDRDGIRQQVDILKDAGYPPKDIFVFVLYNWDVPFEEMERKRIECWKWGVQISDCRFRPLNQLYDHYNPHVHEQGDEEYHIHASAGWTDALVRQFRKNVREQNICVRHGFPFYSRVFEHKGVRRELARSVKVARTADAKRRTLRRLGADYWFPGQPRWPATSSAACAATSGSAAGHQQLAFPQRRNRH